MWTHIKTAYMIFFHLLQISAQEATACFEGAHKDMNEDGAVSSVSLHFLATSLHIGNNGIEGRIL